MVGGYQIAYYPGSPFHLEEDSDLVCQAGARWMDVNEALKERGRFELN